MTDETSPTKLAIPTFLPPDLKPIIDPRSDITVIALQSLPRLEEPSSPLSIRSVSSSGSTSITELSIEHLDLDELALPTGSGYGYKSANLMQLEKLASLTGSEVPKFKAIAHKEVLSYITRKYPTFLSDYAAFRAALGNPPTLTEQAEDWLAFIKATIERIFKRGVDESLFGLDLFIKSVSSDFLIVRSTGKEDSDTTSNAGGNLSIPYTRKNEKEVLSHIGKVLGSYFSERSITQRIASQDKSLVEDEEPFVPILIQEMCGEPLHHKLPEKAIPRSGVIFIRKDISEASIGLGHNEGIVSSKVSTDTYHFTRNGGVSCSVREKFSRFRGVRDGDVISCREVPCPKKVGTSPSLTKATEESLQQIAREIYDLYDKEMDVEFTIINSKVYLLQARPLPKKTEETPSYINIGNVDHLKDGIVGETLLDGGNFVRRIESPKEIIVVNTITEAYNRYVTMSEAAREEIKGIILKKEAPRTSHEAVFFKGRQLPILVVALDILEPPFYLDPQQGVLVKAGDIKEGFICYPIPLKYSLKVSKLALHMDTQLVTPNSERGALIRESLTRLQERVDHYKRTDLDKIESVQDIRACLFKIKQGTLEERERAIGSLVAFVSDKTKEAGILPKSRIELIVVLENLIDILDSNQALLETDSMSLERLYVARLLEAVLFQKGTNIIGGFSLMRILEDIRNQRKGAAILERPREESTLGDIPFAKMKKWLFNEDLKKALASLFPHLPNIPEEKKETFKQLLIRMHAIGGEVAVLNAIINDCVKETGLDGSPINLEQALAFFDHMQLTINELDPALERADAIRMFVEKNRANMSSWSNPTYFQTQKTHLIEELTQLGLIGNPSFSDDIRKLSPKQRLIIIQSLKSAVRCFDEIIKTCTGSTEYSSKTEKVKHFFALLHTYRDLSDSIHILAGFQSLKYWDQILNKHFYPKQPTYADAERHSMGSIGLALADPWLAPSIDCTEETAEEFLKIDPDFHVNVIVSKMQGVKFLEEICHAVSLEEKFTLFHQLMESELNILSYTAGFTKEIFPQEIQDFIPVLQAEISNFVRINQVSLNEGILDVEFSIPLSDHEGKFSLQYDLETKSYKTTFQITGGNEFRRWDQLHDVIEEMKAFFPIAIEENSFSPGGIIVKFEKSDPSNLRNLCKVLKRICQFSFGGFYKDSTSSFALFPNDVLKAILEKNPDLQSSVPPEILDRIFSSPA